VYESGCGLYPHGRVGTLDLADFCKSQQIRECGFRTLVLIGPVEMKSICATAGSRIYQCRPEIVFTQEPPERAHRLSGPVRTIAYPRSRKAGRNRCARLDWLLVKRFGELTDPAETVGANRPEMSCRRRLKRHEPTQRPKAGLDVCWLAGRQARFDQCLGQSRVVIGE
jgi:hypothetical protein